MTTRALFLNDGTQETGLGHVSRSLGLAEALAEMGATTTFAGEYAPGAGALLHSARVDARRLAGGLVDRWDDAIDVARGFDLTIVDSYNVSSDMLRALDEETTTVCIDDYARLEQYRCRGIINFTVGAPLLSYDTDAARWLGPRYFLVRRSIRRARPDSLSRSRWPVRRVLVVMGGIDRHRMTLSLVDGIRASIPRAAVRAVVGTDHPDEQALATRLDGAPSGSGLTVQAPDLAELLTWCDICVSGGGLTKYESAFMGALPAVVSQSDAEATETGAFQAAGLGRAAGTAVYDDGDAILAALLRACEDEEALRSVARTSPDVFGEDPTAATAQAILELVTRRG